MISSIAEFLIPVQYRFGDGEEYSFPAGIVLVHRGGSRTIIGDDIEGARTTGCSCCSSRRDAQEVSDVIGYYDLRGIIDNLS